MSANSSRDPSHLVPLIWLAQFGSVVLLMALTWFLPDLMAITPIAALSQALLLAALLAAPAAFMLARWLMSGMASPRDRYDPLASAPIAPSPEARFVRYILTLALCEIPAILALIAVLTGADPLQALGAGATSLFLLLLWRRPVRRD